MVASDDTCSMLFPWFLLLFFISFSIVVSSIIRVALGGGDSLVRSIVLIFVHFFFGMGFY
jgi:hypothetical protein